MSKRILVGIDPGQQGAIAVFGPDGLDVRDLKKCYSVTGTFNSLDPGKLSSLIVTMIPYDPSEVIVYCEESTLHPKNGVMTYRSVFDARGVLRTAFVVRGMDVQYIAPATWKSFFGLLKTEKTASIEKILEYHPDYKHLFYRPYQGRMIEIDGRAEAALIALYGRHKERHTKGK